MHGSSLIPGIPGIPGTPATRHRAFMTRPQRDRLVAQLYFRVVLAASAYRDACLELDLDLDPREPWLVTRLLDVIGASTCRVVAASLQALRDGGATRLARVAGRALVRTPDIPRWASASFTAVRRVSEAALAGHVQRALAGASRDRPRSESGAAFTRIAETAAAAATDAELVVLFEAFDPGLHTGAAYRAALGGAG
jgi:hypothetical protein